jgi:hypothetical protein
VRQFVQIHETTIRAGAGSEFRCRMASGEARERHLCAHRRLIVQGAHACVEGSRTARRAVGDWRAVMNGKTVSATLAAIGSVFAGNFTGFRRHA